MKNLNTLKLVTAVALAMGFGGAQAATAFPASMTASVSVASSCTLTGGAPFAFSPYTSGQQVHSYATSTVTANCSNMTAYSVGIDRGAYLSAAAGFPGFRALSTGAPGQALGYEIRALNQGGQQWGDGGHTINFAAYAGTGSGAAQVIPAVGIIFGGQAATSGNYNDQVTVTLTY